MEDSTGEKKKIHPSCVSGLVTCIVSFKLKENILKRYIDCQPSKEQKDKAEILMQKFCIHRNRLLELVNTFDTSHVVNWSATSQDDFQEMNAHTTPMETNERLLKYIYDVKSVISMNLDLIYTRREKVEKRIFNSSSCAEGDEARDEWVMCDTVIESLESIVASIAIDGHRLLFDD